MGRVGGGEQACQAIDYHLRDARAYTISAWLLFYKHAIAVLDDLRGRGYFRKGFEQAVREYDSVEVGE